METNHAYKENLDKSKVTGIEQVDTLQDGVHNLVAGQVGQGGLLQPVGDMASKEGVNRAERGGKDNQGNYAPGTTAFNSVADGGKAAGGAVADGGKATGGAVVDGGKALGGAATSGIKGAGNFVGSAFGGGNKAKEQEAQKPAQ